MFLVFTPCKHLQTGELSSGDILPSALGQLLNVTLENMPDTDGDNYTVVLTASESNATLIDTDYCNCDSCTVSFRMVLSSVH